MRLIIFHLKVLGEPPVDISALLPANGQLGEVARLALELDPEGVEVVQVDVGVAHDVYKVAGRQVAHVRQHVRQQRIRRDVERHAEAHVARALVQLAREHAAPARRLLALAPRRRGGGLAPRVAWKRHVELAEHMARRQGHLGQVGRVPGAEDNAAVVGIGPQLMDDLGQLVDALTGIVGAGIDVHGAEVAPLEAVDGAEVADGAVGQADLVQELARAVAVPDLDVGGGEREGRGAAGDEPEQLGDDGAEKDALRGQERENGDRGGFGRRRVGPRALSVYSPRC